MPCQQYFSYITWTVHIFMLPGSLPGLSVIFYPGTGHPVVVLSPQPWTPGREVTTTILIMVFGMTRSGIELTTSHTRGGRSTTRPPGGSSYGLKPDQPASYSQTVQVLHRLLLISKWVMKCKTWPALQADLVLDWMHKRQLALLWSKLINLINLNVYLQLQAIA